MPVQIFSATIISSIIPKDDIKRTAEWQLLLGAIALPGTYCLNSELGSCSLEFCEGAIVGVVLCNPLGRRNTVRSTCRTVHSPHVPIFVSMQMILGFAGYIVFGLIIGLAH